MKNTLLMFKTMISGLFSYNKFEDKEEFWDWYWNEQIPDSRYPGESLYECWDTFKYYIAGKAIFWNIRMWFESRFNKKIFGYSWTFKREGYFINKNNWFVPIDKTFAYGCVDRATEYTNNNPYFV